MIFSSTYLKGRDRKDQERNKREGNVQKSKGIRRERQEIKRERRKTEGTFMIILNV